jgi:hypothetical protein
LKVDIKTKNVPEEKEDFYFAQKHTLAIKMEIMLQKQHRYVPFKS